MQKKLSDGVLALGNGFLQYESSTGDCTIIFPCLDPGVYERVSSMQEMNHEYDIWVVSREIQLKGEQTVNKTI